MGRVVAVINQKGGTGKTTTTANLGHALALAGNRVLLVDADPQANLTSWLGAGLLWQPAAVFADVLRDPKALRRAIEPTALAGLSLVHGSRDTAFAERELAANAAPSTVLRRALREADFDVVLIDCPPSLGLVSINAIVAAGELLVPVAAQSLGLVGIGQLRETIEELLEGELLEVRPRLRALLTLYDGRIGLARDVQAFLRDESGVELFATPIRVNTKLAESFGHGQTVLTYAPSATGAADYRDVAKEMTA